MINSLFDAVATIIILFRAFIYDLWIAIKPSRFGVTAVLIFVWIAAESGLQQGRDAIGIMLESNSVFTTIALLGYLSTAAFSFLLWSSCRISNQIRPGNEKTIMLEYRTHYPSIRGDRSEADIKKSAERRVNMILLVRNYLPRLLGILPPLILLLGFYKATGGWEFPTPHIGACLALSAALFAFYRYRRPLQKRLSAWMPNNRLSEALKVDATPDDQTFQDNLRSTDKSVRTYLCVLIFIVAGSGIIAGFWPVWFGDRFGALPTLYLCLSVLVVLWGIAVMATPSSNIPVTTLVVVVLFGLHQADDSQLVNFTETKPKRSTTHAVAEAINTTKKTGPIVFVATAGGGSRAAYWTGTILGELHDQTKGEFSDRLFAISGVSGGSVGALFYRAALSALEKRNDTPITPAIQYATRQDFLSPTLASWFTRDVIPYNVAPDRGSAIERKWIRSFRDACMKKLGGTANCKVGLGSGFMTLWDSVPEKQWPALLLNGTVVESGSRVVASSLQLHDPKTAKQTPTQLVDVIDIIAARGHDLRAPAAGSLSARFPIVLPGAQFHLPVKAGEKCILSAGEKSGDCRIRHVVDGGYFDNFGAQTLLQLLKDVRNFLGKDRKIIVIQISSDPDIVVEKDDLETGGSLLGKYKKTGELLKVGSAALNLRSASGRQAMYALKKHAEENGMHYAHFRMCPDDRQNIAPLGWLLSTTAQKHMNALLKSGSDCSVPDIPSAGAGSNSPDNEASFPGNAAKLRQLVACVSDPAGELCNWSR